MIKISVNACWWGLCQSRTHGVHVPFETSTNGALQHLPAQHPLHNQGCLNSNRKFLATLATQLMIFSKERKLIPGSFWHNIGYSLQHACNNISFSWALCTDWPLSQRGISPEELCTLSFILGLCNKCGFNNKNTVGCLAALLFRIHCWWWTY